MIPNYALRYGTLAAGLAVLPFSSAVEWLAHGPAQQPELVGPGIVSTDDRHETFPAIDPVDGSLWFSVYTDDFDRQTILRAAPAGDGWTAPEAAPFSSRWGGRAARFSLDGSRLYFTSNRPLPGETEAGGSHIWQVDRLDDGGWSAPRPAPGATAGASDIHNSVAASGAFYVASTRPGGFDRYDLYRIAPDGTATHLPAPVNDAHPQTDVWVSADERWMILVVTGHPDGLGGDDLFTSHAAAGGWGTPHNPGAPINSPDYEYGPSVSPDGRFLYFTSHRRGTADVFRVRVEALDP